MVVQKEGGKKGWKGMTEVCRTEESIKTSDLNDDNSRRRREKIYIGEF